MEAVLFLGKIRCVFRSTVSVSLGRFWEVPAEDFFDTLDRTSALSPRAAAAGTGDEPSAFGLPSSRMIRDAAADREDELFLDLFFRLDMSTRCNRVSVSANIASTLFCSSDLVDKVVASF